MIKVTSTVSSEPIDVQFVKDYLHWIDTTSAIDTMIGYYITAAREAIEKRANLSLVKKSYSQWIRPEQLYPLSANLLYPPHISVTKVVRIADDGTETELTKGTGYDLEESKQFRITFNRAGFHRVDFEAGYGSDYGQDLPALLKMAIAEQVGNWYEGETDVGEISSPVMAKISQFSMNTLV